MTMHLATIRESDLLPPITRACLNFITMASRAPGRNHIAPTPSEAIAMLCFNSTVGFPLSAPVLRWSFAAQSTPRRVFHVQQSLPCKIPLSTKCVKELLSGGRWVLDEKMFAAAYSDSFKHGAKLEFHAGWSGWTRPPRGVATSEQVCKKGRPLSLYNPCIALYNP